MKHFANFLALLAGILPALSFVIPDEAVAKQVFIQGHEESSSFQFEEFKRVFEKLEDTFEEKLHEIIGKIENFEGNLGVGKTGDTSGAAIFDNSLDAFHKLKPEQPFPDSYEYFDGHAWMSHYIQSTDALFASFPYDKDHHSHGKYPKMPPYDHGSHTDSTLFEIITNSKYTTKLAELIKQDNDLVHLLKDPKANLTIFAPEDEAFDRLPNKDPKDVPKDLLRRVLMYHIADGTHDSQDLIYHNTLITKLHEDDLGKGMHQRVRIGFGSHGPAVNYYSKLTMVDVVCNYVPCSLSHTLLMIFPQQYAKNGVIHGVDSLLLPPPSILELVEVLPTEFSTSEAAIFRTGLTDELKKRHDGLTVFLPSNKDWEKLGIAVNAFLFSDHGRDYLKAIMKYHISPGNTLYSDAYVDPNHKKTLNDEDDPSGLPHGYQHVSLPTLLKDRYISADITRYERFLSFRVNGLNTIGKSPLKRNSHASN